MSKVLNHSEFEANFTEVENCTVIDNNSEKHFISSEKDSYCFSDGQDSIHVREFDNGKTAYMDYKGCCYVSELTLKEEVEFQLEDILDKSMYCFFLFDKDSLLEKFPDLSEKIIEVETFLSKK
jgi:Fe-S cluster biogenesis protein NfuA